MNPIVNNLVSRVRNHPRLVAASLLGIGGTGYVVTDHYTYLTPTQAYQKDLGSTVRVKMDAQDVKSFGPRVGVLVNDVPFRNDPEGKSRHTVRIPAHLVKDPASLLGRQIRVVGRVEEYQGKKQIVAEEVN